MGTFRLSLIVPAFEAGEIWSHYLDNIVIWAPGNPPGIEEKVRKALARIVDAYELSVIGMLSPDLHRSCRRVKPGVRSQRRLANSESYEDTADARPAQEHDGRPPEPA